MPTTVTSAVLVMGGLKYALAGSRESAQNVTLAIKIVYTALIESKIEQQSNTEHVSVTLLYLCGKTNFNILPLLLLPLLLLFM